MANKIKFLRSTVGLMFKGRMTRFEFYENEDGAEITIVPVHGETLKRIKSLKTIKITREEYDNIYIDPYDDTHEWCQTANYFLD